MDIALAAPLAAWQVVVIAAVLRHHPGWSLSPHAASSFHWPLTWLSSSPSPLFPSAGSWLRVAVTAGRCLHDAGSGTGYTGVVGLFSSAQSWWSLRLCDSAIGVQVLVGGAKGSRMSSAATRARQLDGTRTCQAPQTTGRWLKTWR